MRINKRLYLIAVLLVLFMTIIGSQSVANAGFFDLFNNDIDRINQYYITVKPRKDSSLDIRYDIQWEILSDDAAELTEVFIGIPNSNLNQVKAITNNISGLKESNGLMKVTFKQAYKGKQTIDFSFSIHQMNMYTLENGNCNYSFTPGWFDEIEVKDIKILWDSKNVLSADTKNINSDGYYVWEGKLGKGKKMTANVSYLENTFHYSKPKTNNTDILTEVLGEEGVDVDKLTKEMEDSYNEAMSQANMDLNVFNAPLTMDPNTALKNIYKIGGLAMACCLGGFVLSIASGLGRGYSSHGGYGYYGSTYGRRRRSESMGTSIVDSMFDSFFSGGGHGGGGGCACACACAGGGRAGCSKKDFYGTNIKTKNIEKVLKTTAKEVKN